MSCPKTNNLVGVVDSRCRPLRNLNPLRRRRHRRRILSSTDKSRDDVVNDKTNVVENDNGCTVDENDVDDCSKCSKRSAVSRLKEARTFIKRVRFRSRSPETGEELGSANAERRPPLSLEALPPFLSSSMCSLLSCDSDFTNPEDLSRQKQLQDAARRSRILPRLPLRCLAAFVAVLIFVAPGARSVVEERRRKQRWQVATTNGKMEGSLSSVASSSRVSLQEEFLRSEFLAAPFSLGHRLAVRPSNGHRTQRRNPAVAAVGEPLSVAWSSSTGIRFEDDDVLALRCARGDEGDVDHGRHLLAISIEDARREVGDTGANVWTIDSLPDFFEGEGGNVESAGPTMTCEFRLYTRGSTPGVVVTASGNGQSGGGLRRPLFVQVASAGPIRIFPRKK